MARLNWKSLLALAGVGVLLAGAFADWYSAAPPEAAELATYVGRDSCASCHEQESRLYRGSHHDHAMDLPTDQTVRGDFDDAVFERLGVTTTFFRRGEEFWVNTEGPDGKNHDYQVAYTFGYEPLQQYMIELEGGRVQVLRVSWDTEQEKWFYVPAPDAPDERLLADDPLHWTGLAQNWNTMCAECHSTNLQKGFDLASNTYNTTFSEIDVSCESCHGPGSLHIELAEANSLFWDRRHGYGLATLKGESNDLQIESCAPCHARRGAVQGDWRAGDAFHEHYQLSLLEPGLYHADGQILDEVYVYGSFLQSRMYHENVKCTDCHDPHSLQLKYAGNLLCTQCHQNYDNKKHHFHDDLAATQCVNCHMPMRHYMVNDGRRDHSFRIPRPDLSVELGTPNACNDCHTKPTEDAAWAAEAVRKWYGPKRPNDPHYAPALAAAWEGEADAIEQTAELLARQPPADAPGRRTPDLVRATALRALGGYRTPESDELCLDALDHENPLVRATAIGSLSPRAVDRHAGDLTRRLDDASLMVRGAAADALVQADPQRVARAANKKKLKATLDEVAKGRAVMADRAGPHLRLAQVASAQGDLDAAIGHLRDAIRMESYLTGPRSELARMLSARGGASGEVQSLREEEAKLLRRDTELLPDQASPHYRLGMLLYLLGRHAEAVESLEEACRLEPESFDNLTALALLQEQQRQWGDAIRTLKQMNRLRPNDPTVAGILQRIQQTRAATSEE